VTDLQLAGHTGFRLTKTGIEAAADATFEQWESFGRALRDIEGSIQWWIGDWLNYGEHKFGERYAQAVEETHYSYQTLANMKYVASKVEPSRRRENISFSAHAEVAPLSPPDQEKVLSQSAGKTRKEVRAIVHAMDLKPEHPMPALTNCPTCGQQLPK
jgi:hypothetical protein